MHSKKYMSPVQIDDHSSVFIQPQKKFSYLQNISDKFLICSLCLDMLKDPMQCLICDTLLCEACLHILNISEKKCFGKCEGNYKKANKFLREALSLLHPKCETCKTEMKYNNFYSESHVKKCLPRTGEKDKILLDIKMKNEKIVALEEEVKNLNIKKRMYHSLNYNKLLIMPIDLLRKTLMTFELTIDNKMEMYYACTEGNLEKLEHLINVKKYPILEEISYKNYYWTPLHYAMHYGKYNIISFLINKLKEDNLVEPALRLQSNDNRCPVLCLLKSNHLTGEDKESILEKLMKEFNLSFSKEVKKEAHNRGYDKLLKKYGKL